MRNHRDLHVWNKAYALTLEIYKVSRGFPKEELYGLTSQMRRAAISVGANIAEGVAEGQMPRWEGLSELQWDQQRNWITICFYQRTLGS